MADKHEEDPAPRLVDISKVGVLGLSELAARWSLTKQRVDEITAARCPHWRKLRCGRVWLLEDIEKFEKTWTRKTGVHVDRE